MTVFPVHETFRALGDPTRRQIVDWLAEGDSTTATEVARRLPISRQAVARHMTTLQESGVVHGTRRGREYRYRLNPEPLDEAAHWLRRRTASWERALERLADHLDEGTQ